MASSRRKPSAREKRAQFQQAARDFLAHIRRVGATGSKEEVRKIALFFGANAIYGKMGPTATKVFMPAIRDDFDAAAVRSREASVISGQGKK